MPVQLTKNAIDFGIVTTNGPAMLAFYKDVIGLTFKREMPMPGGKGVMHQFACGDTVVKIVVLESTPAQAAPGGIQGATGYRYWTMTVSNLAECVKACADAGAKVLVPERELRQGVKMAMVADPDGNWVEFLAIG